MPPITQQNLNQIQTQISRQRNVLNKMKKSGVPRAAYTQVQKTVSQMEKAYKQMQKIYVKQTLKKPKYTPPSPKKTIPKKTSTPSFKRAAPVGAPVPKKTPISIPKIQKTMAQIDKMRKTAPPAMRKQLDKQYAMLQKVQAKITPKKVSYDFVGPVKQGVKRETKAEYQSRVTKKPIEVKKQIAALERLKRFAPTHAKKQLEKAIIARKQMMPKVPTVKATVKGLPAKVKLPTNMEKKLLRSTNPIQRALGEIVQKKRMGVAINPSDRMKIAVKKQRMGAPPTVAEKVGTELADSAKDISKVTTPAQAIKNLERMRTALEDAKKIAESKGTPKQLEAINKMLTFVDRPLTHMKNMEKTITAQETKFIGPVAPIPTELDIKQKEIEKKYGNLSRDDIIGTLQSNVIDTTAQETAVADYIKLYGPDIEIELTDGTKMSARDYQDLVESGKADVQTNLNTWADTIYDDSGSHVYGGEYIALGLGGELYGVSSELGMGSITQEEAETMLYNMKAKKIREMSDEDAKTWYKNWGKWTTDTGSLMSWSEFKEKDPAVCLSRDKQGNMKVDYDYNKWYREYKSTMCPLAQGAHDLAGFVMGGITDEDYIAPLIFEGDLEKAQQSSSKWVYGVATAGQRGDIIGGATGFVQSGVFENIILPAATAGTFSVMGKAGTKIATWGAGRAATTLMGKGVSKLAVTGGKVMASKVTPYVLGAGFVTHMGTQLGVTAALEKKLDEVKKAPPGSKITWLGKTYKKEDLLSKLETEGMPTIGFGEIATGIATGGGAPIKGPGWITYGGGAPETYVGATRKQILKLGMQMPAFVAGTRLPKSLGRMRAGWKAYKTGPEAWSQFRAMPEGHPIMGARAGYQKWTARIRGKPVDAITGKPIKDTFGIRKVKAKDMKSFGKRKSLELHPDGVNRRLLAQGKKPMTQQQWNQQNERFIDFQKQFDAFSGHNAIIGAGEKTPSFSNLKAKIKTWSTEFKVGFKKTVTPKPKPKPFKPISRERAMVEWKPPKPADYPIGKVALESGRRIGDLPEILIGRKSLIASRGLRPAGVRPQTTLEQFGLKEAGPRITTIVKGKHITPSWEEIQVMKSQVKGRLPTGKELTTTVVKPRMKGFTTLEKYGLDVGIQAKPLPKGEILIESQQPYKVVEGKGMGVSRPPTYAEAQAGLKVKPSVIPKSKPTQVAEKLAGKVSKQMSLRKWEAVEPVIRTPLKPQVITRHIAESGRFGRYRADRGRMRPRIAGEGGLRGVKEKVKVDVTKGAPTKEIVEIGTFKTPEGKLIPYKKTYPDPRMKNIWKKTPPSGREVIGREGTVSVLKEPTVKTTQISRKSFAKSLAQQRGVKVHAKKGVTKLQKLRQHQFKTNIRKTELHQVKHGRYTEDIAKLRSKVKKEMELLKSKPKLDTAELELVKYNKEILKITEPKTPKKWVDQKPSYRQPTAAELRQMHALAKAEKGVYDLSSYWKKVRTGEISLTLPTERGVTPWSGRGTTLARPVGRRALTEPLWGKKVGITSRVAGRGQLGAVGLSGLGALGEVPKVGQLQAQGLLPKYMQAQETIPTVIYGEDIAEIIEPVPALAEDTITEVIEEQVFKQDDTFPPYPPWLYTWHAPPPHRRIREKPRKEPPIKAGGLLLPGLGGGSGAGGGGRGIGYRPGGYKERIHEVPNIWKATASTLGRWKKPSEVPRPEWAGETSPTKKSKFFTLSK